MGKKDQAEPRQAVFDELGVARFTKDKKGHRPVQDTGLYTSLSHIDVVDLLCEGGIQGIVSGEYTFQGNIGDLGYSDYKFTPYKVAASDGKCLEELGFLRSVYWNEIPVVDKQGFYNFQEVNLEWTDGKPQGQIPALNSNLSFEKNLKGGTPLELSVFRSIGERLFGPPLHLQTKKVRKGSEIEIETTDPGYYLGKKSSHPPVLSGKIDRNAKTYVINNKECVAVRVNIKVPRLMEQIQDDWGDDIGGDSDSWKGNEEKRGFFAQPEKTAKKGKQDLFGAGDMRARKIHYQIYTRPVFDTRHLKASARDVTSKNELQELLDPPWGGSQGAPDIDDTIFGRMEQPYIRSVDIDFLNNESNEFKRGVNPREGSKYKYFNGWEIKIVRLTPDSVHTHLQNESYVDSIVEMYDSKVRYPYCAMAYSKFSAEFFSRIPSRAYDTELLKVRVPNNYDPIKRTYSTEIWDGCFKAHKEWSNNPAWCFYDLITNNRYGLGEYIDKQFVDKWTLYEIAQYCDILVSDGKGGVEPRFTLNHIITSREEAYKIINDMASAFRAIVYYAFGNIYVSQDRPRDPIYHFNTSNVTEGMFNYSSSAKKARHTVAIVRYADKHNLHKPAISYSEDQIGIQRYGIREIETTSIGCTSEAQARRFGDWILRSEILETESVAFTAGQEGMYIRPGDVISIYDEFRNDRNLAGRTLKVEETASGIIPSGVNSSYFPRVDVSGDYRVTGNSIIIDKPLHFTPDRQYRLNLLTPTSYFEPTQITPSDCVESGTTTVIPYQSEKEIRLPEAQNLFGDEYLFTTTNAGWELRSAGPADPPNPLWSSYPDASFRTVRNYTVDGAKAKFDMYIKPADKKPVRFRLYYTKDNVDVEIHDTKYIQFDKNETHEITNDQNEEESIAWTAYSPPAKHGATILSNGGNRYGDLKACLDWYAINGATEEIRELGNTESRVPASCWASKGCTPRIRVVRDGLWRVEKKEFVKPAGVTTLKLELTAPITPTSSEGDTTAGFGFNLYRTHLYTLESQEKISESITVSGTNTDEALTSADIPEIRRNQIQTILFSGYQAVPHTGNYSSEYSINGSGIVTQIWFDNQTEAGLDFQNYVITGYNTSDKLKSEWNDPVDFSTGYENPDGANLIWAIEPADSDIDSSQNYTMDEEFASGHLELYRVINIQENEKKYDISALEYTPVKYVEDPIIVNGPGEGPCGPIDGPRIPPPLGPPTDYCCDGSVKNPNGYEQDCFETMISTGDGDPNVGWELDPRCNDLPPVNGSAKLGTCCVKCGEEGLPDFEFHCEENVTYADCIELEQTINSFAARTHTEG